MEERLLLSSLIAIFVFAGIMGTVVFTGQIVMEPVDGDGDQEVCTEDWTCSDWSVCADEEQTRECTDQNDCGTIESRPPEIQACEMPKEWHRITIFANNEDETTDLFHMPYDTWRVIWECYDLEGEDNEGRGMASVSIYRDGKKESFTSDYAKCEDFENWDEPCEIRIEESGWFYLDVQAITLHYWTARVEAYY